MTDGVQVPGVLYLVVCTLRQDLHMRDSLAEITQCGCYRNLEMRSLVHVRRWELADSRPIVGLASTSQVREISLAPADLARLEKFAEFRWSGVQRRVELGRIATDGAGSPEAIS